MVDFYNHRRKERFTYRCVSWADFAEKDTELYTYTQFTGGNIEYGAYSNLKVSGLFSYTGEQPESVNLLRVYYSFVDADGVQSEEYPLGTFIAVATDASNRPGRSGLVQSGTVTGYSMLKPLSDRLCGVPLTIPAGTDPIEYAADLARSLGLRVNVYHPATYSLQGPHTFEPDDSYLTVVNWCLTNNSTQYQAAYVDGYGVVQMQPYESPTDRTPSLVFANDDKSIMQPEIAESSEWQTAANVTRLYYEDETCAMWACAKNVSGSRTSIDARGGREITYYERVDECADLATLQALARTRLVDRASEIERVSIVHAWLPVNTGDTVQITYDSDTWTGTIQNMSITLAPSIQCQTQIRRAVPATIDVEITGDTLWSV